jgi:hypothetical protein
MEVEAAVPVWPPPASEPGLEVAAAVVARVSPAPAWGPPAVEAAVVVVPASPLPDLDPEVEVVEAVGARVLPAPAVDQAPVVVVAAVSASPARSAAGQAGLRRPPGADVHP